MPPTHTHHTALEADGGVAQENLDYAYIESLVFLKRILQADKTTSRILN